ncbi:putative cofD-like protein [Saccharothrix variisporea]|uniref:Putative cofD-like protein n=1 Tax=Saccharothrix variisporea TaxID=543527 RepID=A0A495XLS1_9PSEU|nr:putative cofD-like protein [Saccharothrix variisporea]
MHVTLTALRRVTDDVTAVVTVADDGGSSGRLRRELGLLPPGDLRKAMVALADTGGSPVLWAELFEHRFGGTGALAGHAIGNLVLAGLLELLGDPVAVLAEAGKLLGVRGRVLPMCTEPLEIEADVTGLDEDLDVVRRIRGQVAIATTPGRVQRIRLHGPGGPGEPPQGCPEAVRAVLDADVVLLGPGSWFTSVLPHLLVPSLHEALVRTAAKKVVVLNLVPQPGETAGFSPELHLDVLCAHAPELRVDAVIADADAVPVPDRLRRAAAALGAAAHLSPIALAGSPDRHDPAALASSISRALDGLPAGPEEASSTTLVEQRETRGGDEPWR